MANILVTGAAGFIGAHAAATLARLGHRVIGCDNFNSYYPPEIKRGRVAALLTPEGVACETLDLCEPGALPALMARHPVDTVLHLAAQPGVRHSQRAPMEFVQSNLLGFAQVLEACRAAKVDRLLYASSSSVYGARSEAPFREDDRIDKPASLYAATKAANEAMAHAYACQHGLQSLGLRFFTVYGLWGRPDMAVWSFSQQIRRGLPITLYDDGRLLRDFTCVDDTVDAVVRLISLPALPASASVVNVGHQSPLPVSQLVMLLEQAIGRQAVVQRAPAPASEVPLTCADDRRLRELIGPWRCTPLADGLGQFVEWLKAYDPLV